MSEDIGEEGQHSRDGLSAPNSEPNSAVQSPHNEPDEDMNDVNGDEEGDEGEGEEGDDAGDESESEEENGEDEAQDAQGAAEGGERPDAAAEPQQQASGVAVDQQASQTSKPPVPKEKRVCTLFNASTLAPFNVSLSGSCAKVGEKTRADRSSATSKVGSTYAIAPSFLLSNAFRLVEPREASQVERSENRLKRTFCENAPVTRSNTAA